MRTAWLLPLLLIGLGCESNAEVESHRTTSSSRRDPAAPTDPVRAEPIASQFGLRDGVLIDAWKARDQSSGDVLVHLAYDGGGGVRLTMWSKALSGAGFERSVGAQESWVRGSSSSGMAYVAAPPAAPDIPWFVAIEHGEFVVSMSVGGVDAKALAGVVDRVVSLEPEVAEAEIEELNRYRRELTEVDSVQWQGTRVRLTEDAERDRRFLCLTIDADHAELCRPMDGLATLGQVVSGDRWLIVAASPLEGSQPTIRTEPGVEGVAADSDRYHYLLYEVPDGIDRVRLCMTVESVSELCTDFERLLA